MVILSNSSLTGKDKILPKRRHLAILGKRQVPAGEKTAGKVDYSISERHWQKFFPIALFFHLQYTTFMPIHWKG